MSGSPKELDIRNDDCVVRERMQICDNEDIFPDRNETTVEETSSEKDGVGNKIYSFFVHQDIELFVSENESTPVPKQGVTISDVKTQLNSSIIEELTDIPKKRARMDTSVNEEVVEIALVKEEQNGTDTTVVKEELAISIVNNKENTEIGARMDTSVNEEEVEIALVKEEQNGTDTPVVKEELAISIVNNKENTEIGARKDTAFDKEKVEDPADKDQTEVISDEMVKPSDKEKATETTFVIAEQNVVDIPVFEKEPTNSIVIGKEDTLENSNSILDDEKRDVLAPTKIDKNISIIKELILETDISKWIGINYDEPYKTVELPFYSSEYDTIYNKFDRDCYRIIKDIKRVQNPFLYTQYHLKRNQKQSMNGKVKEHILFHGTKEDYENPICEINLDWRKMGSSGCVYNKFGNGISFATNSKYAIDYPRRCYSSVRTMFVVRVLEVSSCPGQSGLIIPPEPADLAVSTNVYVKFFDNEFYPEYIVHYER